MSMAVLNRIFLLVGFVGLPICIWGERKSHGIPYLLGIGLFGYLLVSSAFVEIHGIIQK